METPDTDTGLAEMQKSESGGETLRKLLKTLRITQKIHP